jgi:ketosteroid isomerase-like protein
MPAQNVRIVRAVIDGWLRGDPATLELISPDVVYESPPAQPGGGIYRGHDGVLQWVVDWRAEWTDYRLDVLGVEHLGDQVLSFERHRATGKRSGVKVDMESFSLWTLNDGKVIRWQGFTSEGDARHAAGQSHP